ncbi:hypothetical protein [Ahrensia kielensis]|uniref:hypothetical protein n=1 Tax=Ahrensia kielensis TaxID=76980 RepID=UPI0003781D14|nr:hypothetical protein [Ahrensia kielensis]
MNWQAAINLNRDALLRVLAALVAIAAPHLSRQSRNAILRVLRPAESAARRLIVIAARFCNAKVKASTGTLPNFAQFQPNTAQHTPRFKLFDPRKRFAARHPQAFKLPNKSLPRISVIGVSIPAFAPRPQNHSLNAAALTARLKALQDVLSDLPKQAKRLARQLDKRKTAPAGPRRVPPLRPGLPPGYRSNPAHEVDRILKECHALALQAPAAPP